MKDLKNLNRDYTIMCMPPRRRVGGGGGGEGGHINLPPVRPDIDTWFVRLSPTVLELPL